MMRWMVLALPLLLVAPSALGAGRAERRIRKRMDTALGHYLALARDLAADRTEKLAAHARALAKVLGRVARMLPRKRRKKRRHKRRKHGRQPATMPSHGDYYTKRPRPTLARLREQVEEALGVLKKHAADFRSKDLARVRQHFFALSRPLIRYVGYFRAKEGKYWTIWCPMKKAAWVQTDLHPRNPYYGKKMLECGEHVRTRGEPEPPPKKPSSTASKPATPPATQPTTTPTTMPAGHKH